MPALRWKPDWAEARQAHTDWWDHRGLALAVTAPTDQPWEELPAPGERANPEEWWYDHRSWADRSVHSMAHTFHGGAAFPSFWTCIGGPGSLGLFLGAVGRPAPTTLWYEPVITDPAQHPALELDLRGSWWKLHVDLLEEGRRRNAGRYVVGFPDLIENLDTLAQLRDPQTLLLDLIERPDWVREKIDEINRAFFAAYDELHRLLADPWGGTAFAAFSLWGPGKVAKLQCDLSCTISAASFREFVLPALTAQCAWLDHALYHLDGTQAMHHLPALLAMEELDAIEWTPQTGLPGGGSPQWYDLYRRIKTAGKSVQAVGVAPEEVLPLLEAVGPEGMYVMTTAPTETAARALLRRVGWSGEA